MRLKRTPGLEVGMDDVDPGVEELGVAHVVDAIAERGSESLAPSVGQHASEGVALFERHRKGLAFANIQASRSISSSVGVSSNGHGMPLGESWRAAVAVHVDLALGVARVAHALGVGGVDVEALAE